MKSKRQGVDAVEILHRRYIGDDADRKASLQEERVNAEVARMIYELRKEAGLNQKDLAELIGTAQSVISRLEDADYNGHSLSMLSRIAKALNRRLEISMPDSDKETGIRRFVFQEVVRAKEGFFSLLPKTDSMKYVYLIQSIPFPKQRYTGITSDLKNRLTGHNEGRSPHTPKFKPWRLVTYVAFSNDEKALEFEKYLKFGSGRAFANKRLWG